MATTQQKEELVEAIKGPHYYRIIVTGYGAETSYSRISKEAHDFWKSSLESGDSDVIHYVLTAEDKTPAEVNKDEEYEDINASDIPRSAMFLHDPNDDEVGGNWYEAPDQIDHVWGVSADNARVTIEKVASMEAWPQPEVLEEIVDGEDIFELNNRIGDQTDWQVELVDSSEEPQPYPDKGDYVFQFQSVEKGCFFEAIIETPALIDLHKLKFIVDEAANGEDTLFGITYDGEEVDNDGGDTNGKGYYAYVWQQDF